MSRLDEVELVVTNNLSRARARMQSTSYSNLNDTVEIQRVHNREATAEDDHLLSPRRAKRGYVIANCTKSKKEEQYSLCANILYFHFSYVSRQLTFLTSQDKETNQRRKEIKRGNYSKIRLLI